MRLLFLPHFFFNYIPLGAFIIMMAQTKKPLFWTVHPLQKNLKLPWYSLGYIHFIFLFQLIKMAKSEKRLTIFITNLTRAEDMTGLLFRLIYAFYNLKKVQTIWYKNRQNLCFVPLQKEIIKKQSQSSRIWKSKECDKSQIIKSNRPYWEIARRWPYGWITSILCKEIYS